MSSTLFLSAAASAAILLIGVRGLVAIAWPGDTGAPFLAGGLAVLLAASSIVLYFVMRAGRRAEPVTSEKAGTPDQDGDPAESRGGSWLARMVALTAVIGAVGIAATALVGKESPARHRWTFLDETADPGSLGFRIGGGGGGSWAVEQHEAATGARALVNRVDEQSAAPALLLAGTVRARDMRASTRCKVATSGASDACGIVFRVVDDKNHHIARLDMVGRRVVIVAVAHGQERILATTNARVEHGVWQELSVEARGDQIRVSCNHRDIIDVADPLPAHFGSVGLWAPAAAEVYFDELVVETFPASAQALEVLPLLGKGTG